MSAEFKRVSNQYDYALCRYIRTKVFIDGQGVPIAKEIDEHENNADHYLLTEDGSPVATARSRIYEDGVVKLERIAVLDEHQGQGYGRKIVEEIGQYLAKQDSINSIVMSAQDHALPFYQKIGYVIEGEGYMEAGIPHHKMIMNLG